MQNVLQSIMINPDRDNPDADPKQLFASIVSTSGYAMCVTKDDSVGVTKDGMRRTRPGEYVLQAKGVASHPGAYVYHHMRDNMGLDAKSMSDAMRYFDDHNKRALV